jgi:hypothetical protein
MRPATRIAGFAAVLGVTFGAATLAGASLDPLREPVTGHAHDDAATGGHGGGHGAAVMDGPAGLGVSQDGFTLAPEATTLPHGSATEFRFRILGSDGEPVTDYDVEHERRMHLIVVRRDLTGYQHLHPVLGASGASGVWSVRLTLPAAGVYRAYADFTTGGRSMTLATDLFVGGAFAPVALPAPTPVADAAEGYRAGLAGHDVTAGGTAELTYTLSRDGRRLEGVEPYLGADGHLVALREGDLAFLHVHPEESDEPGVIRFAASLPTAGRYRLFLQFRHDGTVRTVAHTLVVSR